MPRIEQVIEDYQKAKLYHRINLILMIHLGVCLAVCTGFLLTGDGFVANTLSMRGLMTLLVLALFILQAFDYTFSRRVLEEEKFRMSREMDIHNAIH